MLSPKVLPLGRFVILLSLLMAGISSPLATDVQAQPGVLQVKPIEQAVLAAVTHFNGSPPTDGAFVEVYRISADQHWAFGSVALLTPRQEQPKNAAEAELHDELPEARLWLAHQTTAGWEVTMDYTPGFDRWLQEAPQAVVNAQEKTLLRLAVPVATYGTLGDPGTTPAASSELASSKIPDGYFSLPWTPGQRWKLTGGPHGWGGRKRPWSALDFAGGDGRVMAAREGLVYRPCGDTTWVQIRHGDGWVTDYYHLTNIPRYPQGARIERGQYVGTIGTAVACGGSAFGAHVHFNIRYNGEHSSWNRRKLGDWTIRQGSRPYQGYAKRSDTKVRPQHWMFNDGEW